MLVLNDNNFNETIKSGVTLVDFFANWCGPCKMLAPTIEELSHDYEGRCLVAKVDVDESPEVARSFGIMSIPTVIIFKDGEIVDKMIGYRLKREFVEVLERYL